MSVTVKKAAKAIVGKVVGVSMKTIVVETKRKEKHPLYGKYINKSSKRYAHDEKNICHLGDTVKIKMARPISKTKSWVLLDVIDCVESNALLS